jgi:hypothetical protein
MVVVVGKLCPFFYLASTAYRASDEFQKPSCSCSRVGAKEKMKEGILALIKPYLS